MRLLTSWRERRRVLEYLVRVAAEMGAECMSMGVRILSWTSLGRSL